MIPFTDRHDPDDVACRELTSKITLLGTLCLIVMHKLFPHQISGDRLAYRFKVSDKRKTLDPILADLWTYGYASHTGTDHWRITDIGRQAVAALIASPAASTVALLPATQPALPMTALVDNCVDNFAGENLRADLSSIDLIDQSSKDRSIIDQIEEDHRAGKIRPSDAGYSQAATVAWLDAHAVTGDKRRTVLAARCTAAALDAWLTHWTREGKTAKGEPFRNKYGPLNYALTCAINGDLPPSPMVDDVQPEKVSEPETADPSMDEFNRRCRAISDARANVIHLDRKLETAYADELPALRAQRTAAYQHWQTLIAEERVTR